MYRPKDWERIKNEVQDSFAYTDDADVVRYPDMEIFEAGADAMLEALKKSEGRHRILPQDNDCLSNLYPEQIGYLVFIPDEE